MKKINFISAIIYSLLFSQCTVFKNEIKNCNENLKFKDSFMSHISLIENYTMGKGERKQFDEGLYFLSKYVHVSYDDMLNFSSSYTSIKSFNKDKIRWLKWYEENKCSNIQFKQ
ncbi:MAG: hypothetical protein RLZZ500_2222 [Bacteroidota bacterium]|jgi:hypothetical protein